MKNNKKLFISIEAIMAVMVIAMAFIMLKENSKKDLHKISVIVPNSNDNQWTAFKYGLKMAAEDQDTEIFFVSTGNISSAEEETNIIKREIENGTDALIIKPVPDNKIENILKKIENKIPVMLIGTTASKNKPESMLPVTEPDNYLMGKSLAEELLKDYNGNITGKTLGIITETSVQEDIINRINGFQDVLKDKDAKISWTISGSFKEPEENTLDKQPTVDIVIALDDQSLVTASGYSAANNLHGALVYGIGHSTEAIYYLDTGIIRCLVVPDEFSTGYKSLTETAESLKYYFRKMKDITVSYTIIRRDELFSQKNQEIIFTMSQ